MTVSNDEITSTLDAIANLLEIEEESPFRIRAYRNAADSIRMLEPPLADMVERGDDLTQLDGIGSAIALKIEEIARTGRLAYLSKLEAKSSPGLLQLLEIPGLGPKRVRTLRDALGVRSLEELLEAARAGRLSDVPGFGKATVDKLIQRLERKLETDS